MPGSVPWTPLVATPKAAANAATWNTIYTQFATANNNHMTGVAGYRHLFSEIDSALSDDTVSPPAISTALVAADVREKQHEVVLSAIMGYGGSWAANYASLVAAGVSLHSLAAAIGTRSATPVAGDIVEWDSNAALNATALITINTHPAVVTAYWKGAASQSANMEEMRNNANTLLRSLDPAGNQVVLGTLTAGSGATQVTDSVGLVRLAALPTLDTAHGGNGLVSPAAGNLLVTNGASPMTLAPLPAGVIAATSALVGTNDTQTLTAKTLTNPSIVGASLSGTLAGAPVFAGGVTFNTTIQQPFGTLGASFPFLNTSATWNAPGIVMQGIVSNVNLAAAPDATSTFLDLQSALVSVFRVHASGNVYTVGSLTAGTAHNAVVTSGGLLDLQFVTGTLAVPHGGSGVTSIASGALVLGQGVSPVAALVGTTDGQVPVWSAGSASWGAGTLAILPHSLSLSQLADGAVLAAGGMSVTVGALNQYQPDGTFVIYSGETRSLTVPTDYRPGTPGNNVYVLLYLNGTGLLAVQQGIEAVSPTMPKMTANATPLAYIRLSYAQTVITAANIVDARVDMAPYITLESAQGIYATTGHIHGQGDTVLQPFTALNEGLVTTPAVAGMSVVVLPCGYTDTSGISQRSTQQSVNCNNNPSVNPRWDVVALTNGGSAYIGMGIENAVPVKPAPTNTTDIVLAYIYMRPTATKTQLTDRNTTDARIDDARRLLAVNQPGLGGAQAISSGGTGVTTFTAGLVYSPGGTTALNSIPAVVATSGTVALSVAPSLTINPTGSSSDLYRWGGTFITGGTGGAQLVGTHVLSPTLSGGGTWANAYTLYLDAPTFGTNPYSLYSAGAALFNTTLAVIGASTLTGLVNANGGIAATLGTITADKPALDTTVTWNNAAITFHGARFNVTNTASAVASTLVDYQLAGTSQMKLSAAGVLTLLNAPIIAGLSGPLVANGAGALTAMSVPSGALPIGAGTGAFTSLAAGGAGTFVVGTGATSFGMASAATVRGSGYLNIVWPASATYVPGKPTASEVMADDISGLAVTLSASISFAYSLVAATASTAFTISTIAAGAAAASAVSIGSIVFAAGSRTGTVSFTSTTVLATDRVYVVAPGTPDTTLSDVSLVIQGTY